MDVISYSKIKKVEEDLTKHKLDYTTLKGVEDYSVTYKKRTPLGEICIMTYGIAGTPVNIDTTNKTITIYPGGYIHHRRRRIPINTETVLTQPEGSSVIVAYDTQLEQFKCVAGGSMPHLTDASLIMMVIYYTTTSKSVIKSIWSSVEYTVDGENVIVTKDDLDLKADKTYVDNLFKGTPTLTSYQPANIPDWYEPSENFTYDDFAVEPTDIENYYTLLNTLIDNNSDYITRQNLGKDSSGLYDIYQLNLKTPKIEVEGLEKTIPKLLIVAGLHGGEITSVISLYYLIKDLCENWKTNEALEYLRYNTEIVMIPCVNPWGFQNNKYTNYNGVNINRNFEAYHRVGEYGSSQYGGPEPFSEIETQHVKNMVDNNTDAIIFIDYHTMGGQGSDYGLLWHSLNSGTRRVENIDIASRYHVEKFSRELIKRYGQPAEQGLFGSVSSSSGSAFAKIYGADKGIPSMTLETFRKFPTDATLYTPLVLKASTEIIGSWLLTVLKQFKL